MFGDISSFISNIRHLVLAYQRAVRSHHPETITRTVVKYQLAHTAYLYSYYTIVKAVCQGRARFSTKIKFSEFDSLYSLCNITKNSIFDEYNKVFSVVWCESIGRLF